MDGDKTAPSAKGKRKIGMVTTRGNYNNSHSPGTDDPNAAPSSPELPKTPELSEVQFKTFDVSHWYPSQKKLCTQWEEEMERLNSKYNLDCFSDSELDLESDKGEEYKYEHGYETLI